MEITLIMNIDGYRAEVKFDSFEENWKAAFAGAMLYLRETPNGWSITSLTITSYKSTAIAVSSFLIYAGQFHKYSFEGNLDVFKINTIFGKDNVITLLSELEVKVSEAAAKEDD